MMSSRPPPDTPLQVTIINLLHELLKVHASGADDIQKWLGELHVQEERIADAHKALDEAQSKHEARQAELDRSAQELETRDAALNQRANEQNNTAADIAQKQKENARVKRELVAARKQLDEDQAKLTDQQKQHEVRVGVFQSGVQTIRADAEKIRIDAKSEATRIIAEAKQKGDELIGEAQIEIQNLRNQLKQEQDLLRSKEEAFSQRASALRAVLPNGA